MNDINYSSANFWLDTAQVIGTIVVAIYVWLANRRMANQAEIDKLCELVRLTEDRLLALESVKTYLPSNQEIGEIHNRVDQVGQGLKNMEGQLTQINNTMQLIQRHLLAEKNK